MKFVDEAALKLKPVKGVTAVFLRREKYIERGGPDGGDGGNGGSVYLLGDAALNTLVDFRFQPNYRADKGEHGKEVIALVLGSGSSSASAARYQRL